MQGSTETTFYVLAVYFGSIGITRIRYTLFIALVADIVGLLSSCWWSALFYTAP
jgi:spore maturation protein SpmB